MDSLYLWKIACVVVAGDTSTALSGEATSSSGQLRSGLKHHRHILLQAHRLAAGAFTSSHVAGIAKNPT